MEAKVRGSVWIVKPGGSRQLVFGYIGLELLDKKNREYLSLIHMASSVSALVERRYVEDNVQIQEYVP